MKRKKKTVNKKPREKKVSAKKPTINAKTLEEQVDLIYRTALLEIVKRQAAGDKLTGADYAFLEKVTNAESEKKSAFGTREVVQGSIDKQVQFARIKSFHKLNHLLDNSKRDDVCLQAALALKKWADEEEPPSEAVTFTVVKPNEVKKIVPINSKSAV